MMSKGETFEKTNRDVSLTRVTVKDADIADHLLPGLMGLGWKDGGVTVNICVSGLLCVCVM